MDAQTADGAGNAAESTKEGKPRGFVKTLFNDVVFPVLGVILVVSLLHVFVGRMYVIPSGSMEPTLHGCEGCTNDRIVAEKISLYFNDPEPGDVVVFAGTPSWNEGWQSTQSENPIIGALQSAGRTIGLVAPDENTLVKRIIAEGGQTVSCQPGDPAVMVDGKPTDQSFVLDPPQYEVNPEFGSEACGGPYFGPIEVPEDTYFMMGDNRTNSLDSRFHPEDPYNGAIPADNIRGKAQFIVFPLSRMSSIENSDIQ